MTEYLCPSAHEPATPQHIIRTREPPCQYDCNFGHRCSVPVRSWEVAAASTQLPTPPVCGGPSETLGEGPLSGTRPARGEFERYTGARWAQGRCAPGQTPRRCGRGSTRVAMAQEHRAFDALYGTTPWVIE